MRGTTLIKALLAGVLLALGLAAPASAATPSGNCLAYVYKGTTTSLCDRFAGRSKVNCPEVGAPVRLVGKSDPWGLDRDGNGLGCESQTGPAPTRPTATPTTPPTTTKPPTDPPVEGEPTTRPTSRPAKPTTTTTPSPSKSTVPAGAIDQPTLPKTGPVAALLLTLGGVVVAGGIGALLASRRRKVRFRA